MPTTLYRYVTHIMTNSRLVKQMVTCSFYTFFACCAENVLIESNLKCVSAEKFLQGSFISVCASVTRASFAFVSSLSPLQNVSHTQNVCLQIVWNDNFVGNIRNNLIHLCENWSGVWSKPFGWQVDNRPRSRAVQAIIKIRPNTFYSNPILLFFFLFFFSIFLPFADPLHASSYFVHSTHSSSPIYWKWAHTF